MLKREFSDDETIKLTSVYRKNAQVFLIDGARQEGDQVFSRGFPADEEVLNLYTCIVLGSFPAEFINPASFTAIKNTLRMAATLFCLEVPSPLIKGATSKQLWRH